MPMDRFESFVLIPSGMAIRPKTKQAKGMENFLWNSINPA